MSADDKKQAPVGGAPAQEALRALIQQFSSRSAFVRELIQNSLDAGAGRIEVRVEQRDKHLEVSVTDDGEGMDRRVIEKYLLTLFRSSKERDLTKIGKFGVGFVSLFALAPEVVVVDTSRDGVHHRVVFDQHYRYTLAEVDDPFEGTAVALHVPLRSAADTAALAKEIRDAVHYWCRYAHAEVWTEGRGEGFAWGPEEIEHPFAVEAPHAVEVKEDGLRAVLGFTAEDPPLSGYYNRGLTLLEAREKAVPGVTFRAESRLLEHTLTRDNVIRDRNYARLIERIRDLAAGPLRDGHLAALRQAAAAAGDERLRQRLLAVGASPLLKLPEDLACFKTADGRLVSLDHLQGGILRRVLGAKLLHAPGPSPLVAALTAAGHTVLLGPPAPDAAVAAALGAGEPVSVVDRWICPEVLAGHPLPPGPGPALVAARFAGRGAAIDGKLATWQAKPGALEERAPGAQRPADARGLSLLVNVDHPVYKRLAALPPARGGPLLRAAVRRALGDGGALDAELAAVSG